MSPRAPKHCGKTGCLELVRGRTYCDAHTPVAWSSGLNAWQGHGTTRAQRKLVAQVLAEEPGVCLRCTGHGGRPHRAAQPRWPVRAQQPARPVSGLQPAADAGRPPWLAPTHPVCVRPVHTVTTTVISPTALGQGGFHEGASARGPWLPPHACRTQPRRQGRCVHRTLHDHVHTAEPWHQQRGGAHHPAVGMHGVSPVGHGIEVMASRSWHRGHGIGVTIEARHDHRGRGRGGLADGIEAWPTEQGWSPRASCPLPRRPCRPSRQELRPVTTATGSRSSRHPTGPPLPPGRAATGASCEEDRVRVPGFAGPAVGTPFRALRVTVRGRSSIGAGAICMRPSIYMRPSIHAPRGGG
jgi:hypothetical protein